MCLDSLRHKKIRHLIRLNVLKASKNAASGLTDGKYVGCVIKYNFSYRGWVSIYFSPYQVSITTTAIKSEYT